MTAGEAVGAVSAAITAERVKLAGSVASLVIVPLSAFFGLQLWQHSVRLAVVEATRNTQDEGRVRDHALAELRQAVGELKVEVRYLRAALEREGDR